MQGMQDVDEQILAQMSQVFKHYQISNRDEDEVCYRTRMGYRMNQLIMGYQDNEPKVKVDEGNEQGAGAGDDDNEDEEDMEDSDQPLSKKKLKKIQRLTVAELKQLVKKPEVVEVSFN